MLYLLLDRAGFDAMAEQEEPTEKEQLAAEPVPSANAAEPEPARVVTAPVAITIDRMR